MVVRACGYDTSHQIGEFCKRKISSCYFISCFVTSFVYESKDRLLTGKPGDILVIPPGNNIYHGPQNEKDTFVNDWIFVNGEDFSDILEQYPLPNNKAFPIGDANLLKSCIKRVQKERILKQTGYKNLISCYLTETIIRIHRLYHSQKRSDISMSHIESTKDLISQNLSKDWTLREMAELSGYSVSHFSSLYAQRFGLSPKADLIASRIQLAKQLLYYSGLSITEISKQCGFQSIYYFSKYFKEVVGISPSEYMKQINSNLDDML